MRIALLFLAGEVLFASFFSLPVPSNYFGSVSAQVVDEPEWDENLLDFFTETDLEQQPVTPFEDESGPVIPTFKLDKFISAHPNGCMSVSEPYTAMFLFALHIPAAPEVDLAGPPPDA